MNIEMFMAQMNTEHKDAVIQKHIVRQYVPLEEKIAEAKRIVALACYNQVEDADGNVQKVFSINSVHKEFYAFLSLIKLYTDIDFSEDILKDYNTLAEKKYNKKLIAAMPEDAVDFNTILNMTFSDEIENATAVGNVINRLFTSSDYAFSTIIKELVARSDEDGEGQEIQSDT